MNFLKGYKTYIVAALMVLIAIMDLLDGSMSLSGIVNDPHFILLLEGFGIGALRHAIS